MQNGDRRRGTDLILVQETRQVPALLHSAGKRRQTPAVYLSELGPHHRIVRLRWLMATGIIALAGLTIIGVVIFGIIGGGNVAGVLKHLRFGKPHWTRNFGDPQPRVWTGRKTDRLTVLSKGSATLDLIYERVVERRGGQDFVRTKPYAHLTATLATESPDDEAPVPAFDPYKLFGNGAPDGSKDQTGEELTSDPRVTVHLVDISGGFLPDDNNQELSDQEAERLVAEADAVYTESEPGLMGAADLNQGIENAGQSDPEPEKNTTIMHRQSAGGDGDDPFDRRTVIARGGESLNAMIKGVGVDPVQSRLVADAIAKFTKTKRLRPQEELRLALTPSEVDEGGLDVAKVSIFYQGEPVITIARTNEGGYAMTDKPLPVETRPDENPGGCPSVYASTYRAARSQDLPDNFVTRFLKVYAYDVDLKQRVKAGDGFELFYEIVHEDGVPDRPGGLLYVAATAGGETHAYYRFRTPDGSVDYYSEKGSNSKKFLMRIPVRAARLTSGFGYRLHPLLKTLRLHSGIDLAAPIGTPIMAAGDGTIEVAARQGGYGNYVRIRHANGYKTAYGHMLRFAPDIGEGVKVRQGQIIGYLGNTGMSTGPHVHYEVLLNNRFTNPLLLKIPRSRQLQGHQLTEFRRESARIEELMRSPPVKTRVATVDK